MTERLNTSSRGEGKLPVSTRGSVKPVCHDLTTPTTTFFVLFFLNKTDSVVLRQLSFYYSYGFLKRNILALIRVKNISSDRNSQVSHRFIIYTIDFDRQINTEEAMCPGFVSFRLSTHCWGPAFLSPKARTLW